nr:MAG TPA: hypothetical protein [Caudoviricetes sp.]
MNYVLLVSRVKFSRLPLPCKTNQPLDRDT